MMKKIEWLTPNKIKFESPHKVFNQQCKLISTGNIISDTQIGFFIRPYHDLYCNGVMFETGHLQRTDLLSFDNLPSKVREYIREKGERQTLILYEFRHWYKDKNRRDVKVLHGYVITSYHHEHIATFRTNTLWKSQEILKEAIQYVIDGEASGEIIYL